MVQLPSSISEEQVAQQLNNALGQSLSAAELSQCLEKIEFLEPGPGKPFWQSVEATPGIYLVLDGKVRLLYANDSLIASLEDGQTFGELTLFPKAHFQPYKARASLKLQLAFLPNEYLQTLIRHHPGIREHLCHQAVLWDLLLLCRQIAHLKDASLEQLTQMLALLDEHNVEVGRLPASLFSEQKLWLLRRGEIVHSSGQTLSLGTFYPVPPASQRRDWQVTESVDIYTLSQTQWDRAKRYLPQLEELIQADTPQEAEEEQGTTDSQQEARSIGVTPPSLTETPQTTPTKRQKPYFPSPKVKASHWWQHIIQRYPFYEQQSAADCGAACIVMIGRYWGKRFSINRVRDLANINRNGASIRGLSAAAESIGFSTRPIKADYKALSRQPLPLIAHWGGNHYIVVYKMTADRVIVADPALGQRSLKRTEFNADWTGYALLVQPTPFLTEADEAQTDVWRFFELIRPHGLVLFEVILASVLIQVFGLLTPLLTQLLLDRVVVQRSELTLMAIAFGLLLFGLFKVAMTALRQYLLYHTANRVDLALIVGFINHAFRLPLRFFESRYVGDIISRVQENHKIQRFFAGQSLSIALDLLTSFVYLALMFWYSWKLGLLVLAIVPPFVILALVATPFLQRISRRIFNASAVESSYLIQSFTGIRTVKSMAIERSVRWHWEELFNKSLKMMFSGQVINTVLQTFSSGIEAVATAALLGFGAWLVIQNQLTIGQLVAFNMLLTNVIRPFQRLIELWNQLQEVMISIERIDDVIEADPEEDLEHQTRQVLPPLRGHIRFEQVTFRYHSESETNTLENITFEVQPGQTIALVGRSGCGKTTISKLILGLYPPTEGKILIDGYDITCISMQSLRQQIGVVDQDTFLFGGTIRENISISQPSAKLEEIIEAARQAGADQFIKELPMGYETQIGEAGGMLSGGQRQRLAIARALMGNPRLLIFDEATSSLDTESERLIQTNMTTIAQDRTTIVIAHRLSTVRNADLILVLDRGVLVEQGNHDQLMAKRGHYFYLNQQQLTAVG